MFIVQVEITVLTIQWKVLGPVVYQGLYLIELVIIVAYEVMNICLQ